MPHSHAVIFDDGKAPLAPLRDLRPLDTLRCGGLTTAERWARTLGLAWSAVLVPSELADIARDGSAAPVNAAEHGQGTFLIVNARAPIVPAEASGLAPGTALVEARSGELVAARADAALLPAIVRGDLGGLATIDLDGPWLLHRPWDTITFRNRAVAADLALLAAEAPGFAGGPGGVLCIGPEPPRVHGSARVYPGAVLNTEGGPIVIRAGATVRPGAIVNGPVIIGTGATVLEHAVIKDHTAIGPVCKVAGEVSGAIMQGYSNKSHDGFLGDSWLGEWVNLGAGTTVSNLLNTYGEITAVAEPGGSRERTGHTFFGCVLGDHVKTAIGTRIMTGSVVHTGAMWADPAPLIGCIPRFAWATGAGHQRFRMDRFEHVMRTAMARRKHEPSGAYLERLRSLA